MIKIQLELVGRHITHIAHVSRVPCIGESICTNLDSTARSVIDVIHILDPINNESVQAIVRVRAL